MYRDVRITNFRNIESLALGGLSRINLITGPNGAGKTALLEALFLNASACNTLSINTINALRREISLRFLNDRPFRSVFRNLQPEKPVRLAATWNGGNGLAGERILSIEAISSATPQGTMSRAGTLITGLQMTFEAPGVNASGKLQWIERSATDSMGAELRPMPTEGGSPQPTALRRIAPEVNEAGSIAAYFVSPLMRDAAALLYHFLVRATLEKKLEEVVEFVRHIDRRVENLIPLSEDGLSSVYVDIGGEQLLPLTLMGNGFANALHIGCAMLYSGCRVFFIDEMEDGVYYLAFKDIAAAVIRLCQAADLQMFITTHSGELAWAFAAAAEEANFTDISMLRFATGANGISAVTFDASDLKNSLHSRLDLR